MKPIPFIIAWYLAGMRRLNKISGKVIKIRPPSKAGMGKRFATAVVTVMEMMISRV